MTAPSIPAGFDPTDPDINWQGLPYAEFAELRTTAPVFWIEQTPEAYAGMENAPGYWAVTKHAEVAQVSRDSKHFSTAENGVIIRFSPTMTRDEVEAQLVMLINHDAPEHTRLRQVISRGFTPRSIAALRDVLLERTHKIIDEVLERGKGDFVEDIASELPLQAIADMLGVPQEDRRKLYDWSNTMMSYDDPDFEGDPAEAAVEILGYFMAIAEDRKVNPRDDIVTKLVNADIDGHVLSADEFGYFVILLSVAGNETTRNAITHGMHAFFQNPEQWEIYKKERPAAAVDEIIRWATPVTVFQRTALADIEVGGQLVKQGERVGLFYSSANFDSDVFDKPEDFNVRREHNPHVAFGGHGAHYCIGANLARMEVELIFNEIADRMPDITQAGEPRRLRHGWINGIKELQVNYR